MTMRKTNLLGMLTVLLVFVCSSALAGWNTIQLPELQNLLKQKPEKGNYMLVDSRPELKYMASHLPWAVSMPYQYMDEMLDLLPSDKDQQLIFYCGGLKCKLSSKAADLALEKGYTNVWVYREGEPGWKKGGNTPWVAINHIKVLLNDPDKIAYIVDARPDIKYNNGTIPGAVNIPWPQFDKMKGMLPADKSIQLLYFCGGLKCQLSHKSAKAAQELGYTDVRVFAKGYPEWKKNSKRAFAMINPQNPGKAEVAEAEKVSYPGEIKKADFLKLINDRPEGLLLVDVKPADEYEDDHIPGAINIPSDNIADHIDTLKEAEQVVFYCATGSSSAMAYYAAEDNEVEGTQFLNAEILYNADGSFEIN